MQKDLQFLLGRLQAEKASLEQQKSLLESQLRTLNRSRQNEARRYVNEVMLPDLKSGTIQQLRAVFPGFPVPMVSAWFGLSEKVDPNISLDSLRMQLRAYLDNLENAPSHFKEKIASIEASIRELQEILIRDNAEHLLDITERIEALTKFGKTATDKLNPELRERMEKALKTQAKKTVKHGLPFQHGRILAKEPRYPDAHQYDSDDGMGLLELWFWYQLLSSDSQCSHEMAQVEPGGGSFGGGGASGSWAPDGTPSPAEGDGSVRSEPTSESSGVIAAAAVASDPDNIETHYDRGAANFS